MRLQAEALVVFRSERLVLDGVSLAAPAGGAWLLLGPNGAGKSTLLRVLAGLRRSDGGTLRWDGADALAEPSAHGAHVGYLGHQDAIKPGLTVLENLALTAQLSGGEPAASLAALDLLGLAALPARLLSAGQRRRLALARLHLAGVPLWLLDEPTLGLDAAAIARLGGLLAGHRAAGGVVVVATHVELPLPEAARLPLG